jgi:hypothetical protein
MSKLVTILGALFFVSYANASIFDEMTGQEFLQQQQAQQQAPTPDENPSCVNFAGKWKGFCTKGDKKSEQTMELKQTGCEYIGSKDFSLPIGGVANLGFNTPLTDKAAAQVAHATVGFVWSPDRTALIIDTIATHKELGTAKAMKSFSGFGEMKYLGTKLQIAWNSREGQRKVICELERQP